MNEITFGEIRQFMLEILQNIRVELQKCQRPADEIILKDEDVMKILGISKRKLQYMRANRLIRYYHPGSQSRRYYLLSDILKWLKNAKNESFENTRRI